MAKRQLLALSNSWTNPRWSVVKHDSGWWADSPSDNASRLNDYGPFDTFEEAIARADKEARRA